MPKKKTEKLVLVTGGRGNLCHLVLGLDKRLRQICDVCINERKQESFSEQEILCRTLEELDGKSSSLGQHINNVWSLLSDTCQELILHYNPFKDVSVCCQNKSQEKEKDSLEQLMKDFIQKYRSYKCKYYNYASNFGGFDSPGSTFSDIDVSGMACKSNRSLTFISLDSIEYGFFAHQLGVNLSERLHETTAVIIDKSVS